MKLFYDDDRLTITPEQYARATKLGHFLMAAYCLEKGDVPNNAALVAVVPTLPREGESVFFKGGSEYVVKQVQHRIYTYEGVIHTMPCIIAVRKDDWKR